MSVLKLLRIFPVISSTVNLMWALDEYAFLGSWMNPAYRAQADALLPPWFKTWGAKGTWVLITGFPMSLSAGLANAFIHRATLQASGALKWYWLGVGFTVAHFFYGPTALRLLKAIRDGEPDGKPTQSMGQWLRMHATRTATTDLPAFICFTIAALG
ncbi:hypothetical protein B0H17DRAFT_1087740 [Mycena rosella]|uniref:Uncharacterized protein n=1 Tax=Mycena rosella TaxID=1033263 RepID=A0AAD7G7Y5_MYCRO|nr:hypothetical protein B0H17DRAFT_1087740 [Mycena rosella]